MLQIYFESPRRILLFSNEFLFVFARFADIRYRLSSALQSRDAKAIIRFKHLARFAKSVEKRILNFRHDRASNAVV